MQKLKEKLRANENQSDITINLQMYTKKSRAILSYESLTVSAVDFAFFHRRDNPQ